MAAKCGIASLLFAWAGAAHAQSADLRVLSSATPSTGLTVGQEVVIATTAINDGPNPAQNVLVLWSAPVFQPFVLEDAQALIPGCITEIFDFEPPTFNFSYTIPTLLPGEQRTCAVRVRVRVVPSDYQLLVGADIYSGQTPDPQLGNNGVLYRLSFARPTPVTIPTMTMWGLIALAAGALCLGSIYRSGGRR